MVNPTLIVPLCKMADITVKLSIAHVVLTKDLCCVYTASRVTGLTLSALFIFCPCIVDIDPVTNWYKNDPYIIIYKIPQLIYFKYLITKDMDRKWILPHYLHNESLLSTQCCSLDDVTHLGDHTKCISLLPLFSWSKDVNKLLDYDSDTSPWFVFNPSLFAAGSRVRTSSDVLCPESRGWMISTRRITKPQTNKCRQRPDVMRTAPRHPYSASVYVNRGEKMNAPIPEPAVAIPRARPRFLSKYIAITVIHGR